MKFGEVDTRVMAASFPADKTPVGSKLDYFLVSLLILVSSNMFLLHFNNELLAVSTAISALTAFLFRRRLSRWFLFMLMGYAVWVGLTVMYYDVWNVTTAVGFFARMIFAYSVLLVLREKFIPVFVDLVVRLSAITIPFYLAGIVFPSVMVSLYNLLSSVPDIFLYRSGLIVHGEFLDTWSRVNFLFYTFSPERLTQNHGFMWEPTAFAFMLIFALLFRIMQVGRKFDRQCWMLIAALITTLSTTGYFVLMVIVAYLMYISGNRYRVVGIVLLIPAMVFVSTSDFLLPKVIAEFERGATIEKGWGNSRFSSFLYDMEDVGQHPLLGLGIFEENRFKGFQKHSDVNGMSDTIARFGPIGFLVMMANLWLSLRCMPKSRGLAMFNALFLLCILLLSWSERLMYLPIFFALQYYHFVVSVRRAHLTFAFPTRLHLTDNYHEPA